MIRRISMSANSPLISIITVVYNDVEHLEETMLSVLNQSYDNIEYIVIDGNSTDGSKNIIEKYSSDLTFYISESDKGIYDAMNKGIARSKGDYIYFLNSGDILFPDTFPKLIDIMPLWQSNDVIYGKMVVKGSNKVIDAYDHHHIKYDMPFCHQAVIVKSIWYKELYFKLNFPVAADYDFFIKLYNKGCKFYNSEVFFGAYDMNGVSNQQYVKTMSEYVLILWQNSKGYLKITNVLTYMWSRKRGIIYLLSINLLGEKRYRKIISILKSK